MRDSPQAELFRVEFPETGRTSVVGPGSTIMTAARKIGVNINCICGGEGQCGKCQVTVEGGRVRVKSNSSAESAVIDHGSVLACVAEILSDVQVRIPRESRIDEKSISNGDLTKNWAAASKHYLRNPLCRKEYLELSPPSLEDSRSDFERVGEALTAISGTPVHADLACIRTLPETLRRSDFRVTVTHALLGGQRGILRVESEDTTRSSYGIALDIGTTTVIANLVDLNSGKVCASSAIYNSQMRYGADVITRIMHAQENSGGLGELHKLLIKDINKLTARLALQAGIRAGEIGSMVCSGNTVMIHFLLGVSPNNIRREPYIPVIADPPPVQAQELGISIHPRGYIGFLPGFGAYVGSDITAGILSSGMIDEDGISLLIDVGTNGEVVLGGRDWLICCSASAGPAFEGAGTSCGVRAIPGAIEKVRLRKDGSMELGLVVGSSNHKPLGICGSGYIDLVAELFSVGFIDRTGRFKINSGNPRIRLGEFGVEFLLVEGKKSATGNDIFITEDDILTLIRTKGSIYTAAGSVIQHVGLSWDDIDHVYISGGFGSHLDVNRSITIGLLPDLAREKFHFIGNGSITGAQLCLLSESALATAKKLAETMTYFDLSTDPLFMKEYTSSLFLPHTDLNQFPTVVWQMLT